MTDYPYGRSGEALCYYEDEVTRDQLKKSGEIGDNELVFQQNGEIAILYEAPEEDDPGRGHCSKWQETDDDVFTQVDAISGDDGMCHLRFVKKTNPIE